MNRRLVALAAAAIPLAASAALLTSGTASNSPSVMESDAVLASQPTATVTPTPAGNRYAPNDPMTWTNAQLAAQVTFGCAMAADGTAIKAQARAGFGGITLLGNNANSSLPSYLRAARAAAPHGVVPFIAGDEEGGQVQRLARLIYPLPSAKYMGSNWSNARIQREAANYGARMRKLGVQMDFGPVADLAIPGYYIDNTRRGFHRDPDRVSRSVLAWATGMHSAGVMPVVKHWPGHGQARDSHTGAASVPALSTLEKRDMIPFNYAFRHGVPIVMVGHLTSSGLTESGMPASESPRAMAYLRAKVGPNVLIVTDSLSMAAASRSLGRSIPTAAVYALRAGADVALACVSSGVVTGITRAMNSGFLQRSEVIRKAHRVLTMKYRAGIGPRPKPLPVPAASSKPTPTPTATRTATPSPSPSASPSAALTPTPSNAPTATPTDSPTPEPTEVSTPAGPASAEPTEAG